MVSSLVVSEIIEAILITFGLSALIIYLLSRLKIPSILGFLISGTIIGPSGLRLVESSKDVELTAEIGLILLMFTIGVEFSLSRLSSLRKEVFLFGLLQVLLTTILVSILGNLAFEVPYRVSVFYGFVVSLSSTAIVLKLLYERGELQTAHGKIVIGISLFQDICVVPFMLVTRLLAEETTKLPVEYLITLLKSFMILGIVFIFSRTAVPALLHEATKARMRELFVLTAILICLSTAYITSRLGLSFALGAFLAGVIVSESEYSSQVLSDITPFKEIFSGVFFISVGMLMDFNFLKARLSEEMVLVFGVMILKSLTIFFLTYPFIKSLRVSLKAGLSLSQVGEFSFVLAFSGKALGLLNNEEYQTFISITVISMFLTPMVISRAGSLVDRISKIYPFKILEAGGRVRDEGVLVKKSNHVIIVGFGLNGKNLAKVLKETGIPYVILDLNPETVRKYRRRGEAIYFGDGSSPEILRKLGIHSARVIVIAISDPMATRRIVEIARLENPRIHIIVRTRYVSEIEELLNLGANEVIPEEFETSLEIFGRVLHHLGVPRNRILELIDLVRREGYRALRMEGAIKTRVGLECLVIEGLEMESFLIEANSWFKGKTIRELDLRNIAGVTIIAVRRNNETILNPRPDLSLEEGDVIVYVGKKEDLNSAFAYLSQGTRAIGLIK